MHEKTIFKGLEMLIFKILVLLLLATPMPHNSFSFQISTNLPWISILRLLKDNFLYFFSIYFFDFVLDCLKPRAGINFYVSLGKLILCKLFSILLIGHSPICFVDDLWHLNMYLRHILTCSCIFHHVGLVYACQVFDKKSLRHFCICLNSDEYQTLGIAIFTHL